MEFVPISRDELPVSGRPSSKSAQLFDGFIASGEELAEIALTEDDKTPESVRSSLDNYVVRHDLPIKVYTRGGRLFIEKSDTKPSERPKRPRKAKGEAAADGDVGDGTVDVGELPEGVEAVDVSDENEYAGI